MANRSSRRVPLDPNLLQIWKDHMKGKSSEDIEKIVKERLKEKAPYVSPDGYKPGKTILIEALVRAGMQPPRPPTPTRPLTPTSPSTPMSEDMFSDNESEKKEPEPEPEPEVAPVLDAAVEYLGKRKYLYK